jgi:2-phosphoglycerate kinase
VVPKQELAAAIADRLGQPEAAYEPQLSPDIVVTGHGKGMPFSKGILSQSLLAAAIDPNDAFDVARDIERDLLTRGLLEIDRRELRSLAFEALTRSAGTQTAERYLVWRKFQNPDRPVIILLGGAAGVGKTSLALEVAHRLGIGRMLSTDSIRQIMRLMLSQELLPSIHGSSYDAHKLAPTQGEGAAAVIEGFRAQTAAVSVGLRASMDRAIAENANIVIDGVSIVPGMIDLEAYEEIADVIFLVVATLDEESFANRFARRATHQKIRAPHRYIENLPAILQIQDHFLELAERHGVPIVDNVSFDRSVLLIIRHVTETLRARGDFDAAELL